MTPSPGYTNDDDLGELVGVSVVAILWGCAQTVTCFGAWLGLPLMLLGLGGLVLAVVTKHCPTIWSGEEN